MCGERTATLYWTFEFFLWKDIQNQPTFDYVKEAKEAIIGLLA